VTVPLPSAPILFDLFGQVVPPQFFAELRKRLGLQAQGIYTLSVLVWLRMWIGWMAEELWPWPCSKWCKEC